MLATFNLCTPADWMSLRRRVDTDMGRGGQDLLQKAKPTWTAEQSVELQLKLIDGITLEKSGGYFQHTGETLPW